MAMSAWPGGHAGMGLGGGEFGAEIGEGGGGRSSARSAGEQEQFFMGVPLDKELGRRGYSRAPQLAYSERSGRLAYQTEARFLRSASASGPVAGPRSCPCPALITEPLKVRPP